MSGDATPTGERHRQQSDNDAANHTCLSTKILFGMAPRLTPLSVNIPTVAPRGRGTC